MRNLILALILFVGSVTTSSGQLVNGEFAFVVYEHEDFSGKTIRKTPSDCGNSCLEPKLCNGCCIAFRGYWDSCLENDWMSSLQIAKGFKIILYRDWDYGGDHIEIIGPKSLNKMPGGWNDQVSSFKVLPDLSNN